MKILSRTRQEVRVQRVLLLLMAVAGTVSAQVSASISGKVEDASNAAIRGATVTVKSLETGATRVVTTDDGGNFRALSLAVGPHEVRASKTASRRKCGIASIWWWGRTRWSTCGSRSASSPSR